MKYVLLSLVLLTVLFFKKIKLLFTGETQQFLSHFELRGTDSQGSGHFGAPRGNRTHKGLDVRVGKFAPVYALYNCVINRIGTVYTSDPQFKLIEIIGIGKHKGLRTKIMYATCDDSIIGKTFSQFEQIGISQDLTNKYVGITNHLHIEIYDEDNNLINPEIYV